MTWSLAWVTSLLSFARSSGYTPVFEKRRIFLIGNSETRLSNSLSFDCSDGSISVQTIGKMTPSV
jgi:hypothetical protein